MAENKNQHFVPRFYLENFSFDGGNRFHLLHLPKLEVRKAVGIRDQCAADYFYGKDLKIEHAFRDLEGATAAELRRIIAAGKMPVAGSDGDIVFRTHVALQWGRTRAHIMGHHEMMTKVVEKVFGDNRGGKTRFEEEMEAKTLEDTMRMSVANSADLAAFIGDLESKLIDANGHGEFVTSDTPLVMTNPFYLGRYPGGVTGLGVQGLVMLLPLSPRYLAIYYDRSFYRVGSPGQRTIAVASIADVMALNNFQCLTADSAVYFRDELAGVGLLAAYHKVKGLRLADRHGLRIGHAVSKEGPQEIVHSYRRDVNYRPQLSFFSLRRDRRGRQDISGRIPRRQPALEECYHEYYQEVLDGRRERGFLRYLAELGPLPPGPAPLSQNGGRTAIRTLQTLVSTEDK